MTEIMWAVAMLVAIFSGSFAITWLFKRHDERRAESELERMGLVDPPILGGGPDYGDDPRVQERWREWDR